MSMSVESLESVRRTTSTGALSMVKPRRLNTLVIGLILVGQLVGGSGGEILDNIIADMRLLDTLISSPMVHLD